MRDPERAQKGRLILWLLSGLLVLGLIGAYFLYPYLAPRISRSGRVVAWIRDPSAHPEWAVRALERCGDAPFLLPTEGFIGFLWDDSFRPGHRHQGLDIFGGTDVGVTPVYSAYPGYLTRMPDWKSSLVVRIPDDPLSPGRQIWTYYTHLADASGESLIVSDFPPGSSEIYIETGTLLGYQGNYSGNPGNPVGVHLHFSIVLDDGAGKFRNELEIENTLDPSPYLGMQLNARDAPDTAPVCGS